MAEKRNIMIPIAMLLILICLLAAVTWVTIRFFNAANATQPFADVQVDISTNAIDATGPNPLQAAITTGDDTGQTDATMQHIPEAHSIPPVADSTAGGITPAVCAGYGTSIRSRDAFRNPLTHYSSMRPDRVTIFFDSPATEDSQ